MTATEILGAVRVNLIETTANFWTDAELLVHVNRGVRDLWRAISNQQQDYFFTTSPAPTLAASGTTVTGVPSDVSIVIGLEPLLQSSYPSMNFFPKRYTHPDMIAARGLDALDPASAEKMFYAITGAGGPVAAPTIYVAPKLTTAIGIRLTYVPTIPVLVGATTNPIPGESDQALIAWTTAHALGKQTNQQPDASWLAIYKAEKDNILLFVAPRQQDEPDVADAMFEGWD